MTLLSTPDGIKITDHCKQKSPNLTKRNISNLKEIKNCIVRAICNFYSLPLFPCAEPMGGGGGYLIHKKLWIKLWRKQALKGNHPASHYLSSSATTNCFNFKTWHDPILASLYLFRKPYMRCAGGVCVAKCKWIWQLVWRASTTNSYYEIIIWFTHNLNMHDHNRRKEDSLFCQSY